MFRKRAPKDPRATIQRVKKRMECLVTEGRNEKNKRLYEETFDDLAKFFIMALKEVVSWKEAMDKGYVHPAWASSEEQALERKKLEERAMEHFRNIFPDRGKKETGHPKNKARGDKFDLR